MQYLILCPIAIFMSLHVPAGACILDASVSPIHVYPVQCVLKHCGVHKILHTHTHTHTHTRTRTHTHTHTHMHACTHARDPKQS